MTAKVTEHEIPDDPGNDPDHPIPYLRVIDVAGYRAGGAILSIVVASPLDGSERSQTRLLDKIQGYLGHIASDAFIADAGTSPTPANTVIEVLLHPQSSDVIRGLLDTCHQWVGSHNASLVVRSELPAGDVVAVKDESVERPIPTAWRETIRGIVDAFCHGDYRLQAGVRGAEPLAAETAAQVQSYLQDYGATLVPLPEEAWQSSVCLWYGDHWDALVDLWTREEGRSDLVLHCRVLESGRGYVVAVHLVYVP